MRLRILLAALLLAGVARADALEDIVRLNREISVATWTGDAMWFEENLADDYVLVTPNGETQTKRDVIRGLVRPGLKMEPYETTEVQVRIYGDAAIVTWPVNVWFNGSKTFLATLDFGGRTIRKITLDPFGRFPDRVTTDNVWPR